MPEPRTPRTSCGAKGRQSGEPCQHQAGWGTTHYGFGHCKMHGGSAPAGIKAAAKEMAAMLPIVMGYAEDTDPNESIMRTLKSVNGSLSYVESRIALYSTPDELARDTPSPRMMFWLTGRSALLAELRVTAKTASDMGVSQRQIDLAERMGDLMGDLIAGVLGDLALTPAQQELAAPIVRRHLELVAGRAAV